MVKLHRGDPYTSNWLMDVGLEADRDRASLLIDGSGHLKLKVWDSNSQLHEARSHDSLAPSDYDVPLWLGWELAISDRYGYLSIQVDWRYCIDIRLVEFPFSMREAYVLGTDWAGAKSSWFSVNELAVYRRPLAFLDKTELRRHSLRWRHAIEQGSGNVWVEFKGHKWLASRTHPIHGWTAAGAGEAPEPAV